MERKGVINVSWTAPSVESGELPITGYKIKLHVVNEEGEQVDRYVTSTSTEVTGLLQNKEYRVYVASLNELTIKELSYCCTYSEEEISVKTNDGKFIPVTCSNILCAILNSLSVS